MIFDRAVQQVMANTSERERLTLTDPTGWRMGRKYNTARAQNAMKLSAVNRCIEVITDSIAKMPVFLMDSTTRERFTDHPAVRLLNDRPNEAMTPAVYSKLVETRRLVDGNSYVLIMRDAWGQPSELLPVSAGYLTPIIYDDGRLWYIGTNPKTGEYRKFWPDDVLHYKAFSTDGITGISVLTRAAQTIATALAAQEYEESFYSNGAQLSGVLETSADLTSKPPVDGVSIKDLIRKEWERVHSGADNAFRTAVLDHGMQYKPIVATQKDAQFVESKAVSVEDISRFFGVPLYKLNAGKQSYSSNEQNAIEYIVGTLHPAVTQYEQEDTYRLLLSSDQLRGLELRRNMMVELRGDWASRAAWYKAMREVSGFCANDIRALEDLPDVEGGNDFYASLNYVPLDLHRELSANRNKNGGDKT